MAGPHPGSENLRDVLDLAVREVLDLPTARNARNGDDGLAVQSVHRWEEAFLADLA